MKNEILKIISEANLECILDIDVLDDLEWIWINRGIFRDILLNLKIDEDFGEKELDIFLSSVKDDEFISSIISPFKVRGYLPVNQFLFSVVEKGFNPTKDMETTVFLKEKLYKKSMIKIKNEFNWILKAMAIDTFLRMSTGFHSIVETYSELYEDNSRILEALLSHEEHIYLTGRWKLERKTMELVFFKGEEIFKSWGEGEAEAIFNEATH